MELHYNLKNLNSRFSPENTDKINLSYKTYPPKCCYSASFVYFGPTLVMYFNQKRDINILIFSPIIKSLFFLYNLKKCGKSTKIELKIWYFVFKFVWHRYIIPLVAFFYSLCLENRDTLLRMFHFESGVMTVHGP